MSTAIGHAATTRAPVSAAVAGRRRPLRAIVLAGGASKRLGADKPEQRVGGRRLLDVALAAVADAEAVVVVGPPRDVPDEITVICEDPPGSGPVAALAAGFAALPDGPADIVVLAADLPRITPAAVAALAAARGDAPVALAVDDGGRVQYLAAVWDSAALAAALASAPSRVQDLLPGNAVTSAVGDVDDVDTPDQLAAARARADSAPDGARATVQASVAPVDVAARCLDAAVGGALAEPLAAAAPFPPFDVSAMDGWAVAGHSPWIPEAGAVPAGTCGGALTPGHARRIATGAPLPAGAERVIRDEEVDVSPDLLREKGFRDFVRDDTRRRGSEWTAGTVLAEIGTRVDEAVASLARSAGVHRLAVRGPIRVTLHTSGDEIAAGGEVADPRRPLLPETAAGPVTARLRALGATVTTGAHLPDAPGALEAALAGDADLVVVIGATGRGVADHLRDAIARAGGMVVVDGVAVRPGGSVLVAILPGNQGRPGGRVLLGLGGNPLAAVAGVALLGPAVVDALTGAAPSPVDLFSVRGFPPTNRWRVTAVEPDGGGQWVAPGHAATSHLAALVGRRGLALIPPDTADGALVERLT
ncbi:NTP transferase domain-containing protein [Candidatus Mycobacterium methanotrophicum]|uniref:Molybdopterin molybdenumtransferase n=1 Tax=Candidatus Mycobacterium methanotrophicum TaxID=2943498 RepID=A0ABY4QTS0_9MYCO|nr:NTP transferase domain-containing protein [Candidatus Mycobacterium methanotrophicum]UQX13500.1 NTP transferase domain-containing protein [Candidatus Mycobacterium methanotrophicum]